VVNQNLAITNLRPYRMQVFKAIMASFYHKMGISFSVEIARQGG